MTRPSSIVLIGVATAFGCGSDAIPERELNSLYSEAARIAVDLSGYPGTVVIQGRAPSKDDPLWFSAPSKSEVEGDEDQFSRYAQSRMPDLTRAAWLSFYEKNRSPTTISDSLSLSRPYVYRDAAHNPDSTWRAIYQEIGQPYLLLMLSQPGYDPKARLALVNVSVASSRLGDAGGWYLLFRKTENAWVAQDTVLSWMQ